MRTTRDDYDTPEGSWNPKEPGWVEIGKRCSVDRRSMWVRFDPPEGKMEEVTAVELCAGREGRDVYVRIDTTNPQFESLLDLFLTAEYAAET